MIIPKLIQRQETPPGGFRFYVAETKTWLPTERDPATNIYDLHAQVVNHYRANRIPIPTKEALFTFIEEQVCMQLMRQGITGFCEYGKDENGNPQTPPPVRDFKPFSWSQVVQFTGTMASWVGSGFESVPIAEIKQRAGICAACPHNRTPEGCSSCNSSAIQSVVAFFAVGTRGSWDRDLKSCDICGCSLIAKTRIPTDILQRNMPKTQLNDLPAHCWLKPKG